MPIASQVKMLRAVREILLGNGNNPLPYSAEPKPAFAPGKNCGPLPRSTPEAEGLASETLEAFYREVSCAPQANAHSLVVLRHGKVVSEGYFAPFRREVWHVTHSLCKTFTGTAVGIAIEEGLFGLDDAVADYFPDKVNLFTPKSLRSITVRQLLTMSSGITFNEITEVVERDWVRGIFASGVAFEPGTRFTYNSMNSFLLSALVHKTSGQTLMQYLTPRLFEPMCFGVAGWEKSPLGREKGGWGMYLLVEDMAKFGQLYLQNGRWDTPDGPRQLVPEAWVKEATRTQITGPEGEAYGYQLWIDSESGNYIMNGMFGQYITVIPGQDMVVVMTAGNPRLYTDSSSYTLMRQYFYGHPPFPQSLPANPVALASLRRALGALRFRRPLPAAGRMPVRAPAHTRAQRWNLARRSPAAPPQGVEVFCGVTWRFPRNRGGLLPVILQAMNNNFSTGIKALRLELEDGRLGMYWEEGRGTAYLPIGFDKPLERSLTVGKESYLVATGGELRENEDGEPVLKIELCLLEHSSCRLMKLSLQNGKLLLRLDEEPQFSVAIESVVAQGENTGAAPKTNGNDAVNGLLNNEFIHYRVAQLCTPQLVGQPVPETPPDEPAE